MERARARAAPRYSASVAALRRTMQQQLATGNALVVLAQIAEKAIIAGNAPELDTLTPRQKALLDRQIALESARQQITLELSHALGMDRAATLSMLLPALPRVEASALQSLRREIVETERKMDALNRRNALLLEHALEYVKFSME